MLLKSFSCHIQVTQQVTEGVNKSAVFLSL